MYKLLNASFYRLIKNKIFFGIIAITLFIAGVLFYMLDLSYGIDIILFFSVPSIDYIRWMRTTCHLLKTHRNHSSFHIEKIPPRYPNITAA